MKRKSAMGTDPLEGSRKTPTLTEDTTNLFKKLLSDSKFLFENTAM